MATFEQQLKQLLTDVEAFLGNLSGNWDKQSYIQMVECLRYSDSIAVKEAMDGLVNEGNPLAIPPIYLASQKHPSRLVREYGSQAIKRLDKNNEVPGLVANKEVEVAVEALIDKFGHYATDYSS